MDTRTAPAAKLPHTHRCIEVGQQFLSRLLAARGAHALTNMTHDRHPHDQEELRLPNIRRRFQAREGPVPYTLTQLAEALRSRGKYVAGATVVLVDFPVRDNGQERQHAVEMRDLLQKFGARVKVFEVPPDVRAASYRDELTLFMRGADAVIINSGSRIFRALRPKEIRAHGVDLVLAASLDA